MKKTTARFVRVTLGLGVLTALMCALPTDVAPVRWRTSIQVPLANAKFNIGDEMQKYVDQVPEKDRVTQEYQFEDVLRVVNVDSFFVPGSQGMAPMWWKPDTVKGEVVGFAMGAVSNTQFEYSQEKLEDKIFDVTLGPIPMTSATTFDATVPIAAPGAVGPVTLPLDLSAKISYARFSASSPAANVTVTNNTVGLLTNVSVSLQGGTAGTVAGIAAGDSVVVPVPVAGLSVSGTASVVVSMTAGAAGSVTLRFSVNGLLGDSLTVRDSLAQFSTSFLNDYDLTDTAEIDYVDYMDGYFSYLMDNQTGLQLLVQGIHHDMWATAYAIAKNWRKASDVNATSSDSTLYFRGRFITGNLVVAPHSTQLFSTWPLAQARMFPKWDSANTVPPSSDSSIPPRSETYVEYRVSTPAPTNQWVTLSARDAIVFIIRTSFVQGNEMYGRMRRDYHRDSDTQDVAVDYPFDDSQIEQLRGRFYFDSMMVDANAKIRIPGRAFIDSVVLTYEIFDPANPLAPRCTTVTPFGRMKNDTVISQSINVTPLVNNWPSMLKARAHAFIPSGTEVMIINDSAGGVTIDTTILGRMTIAADVKYRIKPYFRYHVDVPATIALGDSAARESFKVSGLAPAAKLTDKMAQVKMRVENHTNLYLKLRGLVATDTAGSRDGVSRDSLLATLGSDSLLRISQTYHPDKLPLGYINLFDTSGVVIPNRGGVYENNITLTDAQLSRYARSRRAAAAWLVTFLPKGSGDALVDTDYVHINASVLVEGIAGTDSLFTEDWGD